MNDAKFVDKAWYRLKTLPGAKVETASNRMPVILIRFAVIGGPMADHEIDGQWFISSDTKKFILPKLAVLGFDGVTQNLRTLGEAVRGKECWGQCSIQAKKDGKGYWPAKIDAIQDMNSRVPGGPEFEAANILGNTGTPPPDDADEWNDNY